MLAIDDILELNAVVAEEVLALLVLVVVVAAAGRQHADRRVQVRNDLPLLRVVIVAQLLVKTVIVQEVIECFFSFVVIDHLWRLTCKQEFIPGND